MYSHPHFVLIIKFGRTVSLNEMRKIRPTYLENPGLLFEIFILIRLSIREVIDLNAVLIDFI